MMQEQKREFTVVFYGGKEFRTEGHTPEEAVGNVMAMGYLPAPEETEPGHNLYRVWVIDEAEAHRHQS